MKFTVGWQPVAEGRLADLWAAARNRTAVTQAAHRIERLLESDAVTAGESRTPGRVPEQSVPFDAPLSVIFEVNEVVREVRILTVGWSGRPA